jgi:chromosome segregation ATPase
MAEEKTGPATPAPGGKRIIVLLWIAVVLLAGAIVADWRVQTKSANSLRVTLNELRSELASQREGAAARDRLVTDLITKIEASITSINGELKTLAETSTKQQEELGALRTDLTTVQIRVRVAPPPTLTPGQNPSKDELATMSQPELVAQLSALGDRIERLKNDVVLKETGILQTQITDAKGRIDKAEKDVTTLAKTVTEADLPSMKTKVQEVDRQVSQAEIEVRTLSKAHAEFKQQVSGFFGEVFYNDPWGKYAPQGAAKGK